MVLRHGGSTHAATRAYEEILAGVGRKAPAPLWRLDLVVTSVEGPEGPASRVETVGPIAVNLGRVSEVLLLAREAARGELPPATVAERLTAIEQLPSPYGAWLRVAAAAVAAAAFSRTLGGDLGSSLLAAAAAMVGQGLRLWTRTLALPSLLDLFSSALAAAVLASAGLRLGGSEVAPATLLASVIYLVPGLTLINGFVDLLSAEHLVIGLQRIAYALSIFVALAIAIALAIAVT